MRKLLRYSQLSKRNQTQLISLIIILASILSSIIVINLDVEKTNTNFQGATWSGTAVDGTNRDAFGGDHNSSKDVLVIFSVNGSNGSLLVMDDNNYQKAVRNESFSYDEKLSQRNISNGNVTFILPAGYYWLSAWVGNSTPVTLTILFVDPVYKVSYPLLPLGVIIAIAGVSIGIYYYWTRRGD